MKYRLSTNQLSDSHHVVLDGSKSISNRLLILQQVSNHPFQISNLSNSDDSVLMQHCLSEFKKTNRLNVQNAGTVARFITAFLSTQHGEWTLACAEPMKKRPIKILVDVLESLGAEIKYLDQHGFLPLHIIGKTLESKPVKIDAAVSSQYISALMMIAPILENGLQIHLVGEVASRPYLEITMACMRSCGFSCSFENNIISVEPSQPNTPAHIIFNESDWSAAAFYYSLVAISNINSISLSHLLSPEKSNQGDSKVASYFDYLGVKTTVSDKTIRIEKKGFTTPRASFDFYNEPDMVPAFALTSAALGYETELSGVQNLVIKESNRLVAMQTELKKLGATFQAIDKNTWEISGGIDHGLIQKTTIDTYHDHRIAMAFGSLAFVENGLTINNPEVVSKSYADYWNHMETLGLHIQETA